MSVSPIILFAGAVLLLIGGIVYVVGLGKKWGILIPFGGMLLFGSMATPMDANGRIIQTVWLPIQNVRSEIFLAMGIVGLSFVVIQFGRTMNKTLSVSAMLLLMMGLYAALLRFVHDGPSAGASSVVFAVSTLVPLLLVAAISIDEPEDLISLARVVALVNAVWVGMCGAQMLVNPKFLTLGNQFRFMGILGNPQHAGTLLAFLSVIVLWLLFNDPQKRFKLLYMGLMFANSLFLVWTGSRTGIGMFTIGVSAVLYTKAGKTILFLPVAGIAAYIGIQFVINTLGFDVGVDRIASTENTRDYAWKTLYTIGMDNPIIGVGTMESEKSENSWLFSFAAFGIGMLSLAVLFLMAGIFECLQLIRMRYWLPKCYRPHSDLIVGIITMYFAGAVLEGYMISRVGASMCFYFSMAGAGAMFRKFAREYHNAEEFADDNPEYDEDSEYEDYENYGEGYDDGYSDESGDQVSST